uniref:Uncharacterized protein n=1 Tax=Quercus lobata TaxID=97700 RepID=A0A7N2M3B1_QUELO
MTSPASIEKPPVLLREDSKYALEQLSFIITTDNYEDLSNHAIEAVGETGDANDEGFDGSLPKPPTLDRVRAKARSMEDELAELKAWKRRCCRHSSTGSTTLGALCSMGEATFARPVSPGAVALTSSTRSSCRRIASSFLLSLWFLTLIRTEHEKFGFELGSLRPMRYGQIAELLNGIAERFGWDKIMEGDNVIGLKQGKQKVTLEPGGQP